MRTVGLLEFIGMLPAIASDVEAAGPLIVERACKIVQKKAKAAIGKDHELWPPLAESTIKEKERLGYKVPAPLLRSGELRDSIEYTVHGLEGEVGTDNFAAPFLELGTSKMPPRSFLVSSAIASEDRIHKMAAGAIIGALSGGGHGARDIRELFELLHRTGHAIAELGHDLTHIDDEDEE